MSKQNDNMFNSVAWETYKNQDKGIENTFGPEFESDKIVVQNTPPEELRNSNQILLKLNIDKSGSMGGFTNAMVDALGRVKQSIIESQQCSKIQISKTLFAETIEPEGFEDVEAFNTSYSTNSGLTKLFDSIIDSSRRIEQYIEDCQKKGVTAEAVLCILSDGADNDSVASFEETRECVSRMIQNGVTVCFIAFGSDDSENVAKQLGIEDVVRTNATIHELHQIMNFVSIGTIEKSKGNKG